MHQRICPFNVIYMLLNSITKLTCHQCNNSYHLLLLCITCSVVALNQCWGSFTILLGHMSVWYIASGETDLDGKCCRRLYLLVFPCSAILLNKEESG